MHPASLQASDSYHQLNLTQLRQLCHLDDHGLTDDHQRHSPALAAPAPLSSTREPPFPPRHDTAPAAMSGAMSGAISGVISGAISDATSAPAAFASSRGPSAPPVGFQQSTVAPSLRQIGDSGSFQW